MKKCALLFFLIQPFFASAGGFQIGTQSVKASGMGGMFTAICTDASSVFYNPGGMGIAEKKFNLTIGGFLRMPSTNYLSPYNGNVEMQQQINIPYHIYASYRINNKLDAGLSINQPFGFDSKWDDSWEGRYVTQDSYFSTTFFQPALSYHLNNNISIGAGFIAATGKLEDKKAFKNVGAQDIESSLSSKGTGYGFNIGAFFKLGEKASVGIDYRSAIKLDLTNGDATFTNIPASLNNQIPASAKFNTKMNLPDVLSAGISYLLTNKVTFGAEFSYAGWQAFDSLNFVYPAQPALDSKTAYKFKNVISVSAGIQFYATAKIPVRVGITYDQSPVADGYVSPVLPESDKIVLSAGASYSLNDKLSFDLAYSYENSKEREASYTSLEFNGSYKTAIHNVALGLNFRFGSINKSLHEK